jgi:alpha-mannosidase
MPLRSASLILPHRRPEDFPTHLHGDAAADLLSAATSLWHPALIDAIGALPDSRSADDMPDPTELEGELVVLPTVSLQRLSADWCDRMRTTIPVNAPPVVASASRDATIDELLRAAGIDARGIDVDIAADFLALGFAHLQVELLTRAMHYTSVLDEDQFSSAVVAAARAVVGGQLESARSDLARAFDLLADARHHVYSVDYYVVDLTLLAETTLGDSLRQKLASGIPTSVLANGKLLDTLAELHPESLAELHRAVDVGTACVVGGLYDGDALAFASPEGLLEELNAGAAAARRHLGRDYEVFAQFDSTFSPFLPETLAATGFRGALHASFDGGQLPRADQRKTRWGPAPTASIEALAATPLDIAAPETWLKLAERVGDTIAHDHVATIVLAGWPGTQNEYYGDLARAAKYAPVLGKMVTLEDYFRESREVDDWTTFNPREYATPPAAAHGDDPISSQVDAYRRAVVETHDRLSRGISALVGAAPFDSAQRDESRTVVLNAWNFANTQFLGVDPVGIESSLREPSVCLPEIPACGFAALAAAAPAASIALADGFTLRNEKLEVAISESTGGIQSMRTHRDRGTRLSQRLVYQSGGSESMHDTRMVADEVVNSRNDSLVGEIISRGRLLDASDELVAMYTQTVRIVRALSAAIVEVELEPHREIAGDRWRTYLASRLAWGDDAIAVRRGREWRADETARERIESPEWVEVNDGIGTVTCYALGIPFHRRVTNTWLDTLLIVNGEKARRFQFALAIDDAYPCRAALGLVTAGQNSEVMLPENPIASRGWFLHIGAKNIVMTHLEPLGTEKNGFRLRLLETEGRDVTTTLAAFRPLRNAQTTDFLGNSTGVLSVSDGKVEIDVGAHRWIQIEAEW